MRKSVEARLKVFGFAFTRTYYYELCCPESIFYNLSGLCFLRVVRWPMSCAPDFRPEDGVFLRERVCFSREGGDLCVPSCPHPSVEG